MGAYIYHFSANPKSRVCSKHIKQLTKYAEEKGYIKSNLYIDGTLTTSMQTEYLNMIENLRKDSEETSIFTWDLFHFNKWISAAIKDVKELKCMGCKVFTLQDGEIHVSDGKTMLYKHLKVAVYHSNLTGVDERLPETQIRISEVFCKENTEWEITGIYCDYSEKKGVEDQPELMRLIEEADKYDVLIVGSFGRIDLRTARFMKIRERLNLNIYSLSEGMLHKKEVESNG